MSKQAQDESINSFISEEDLNSYDYEDDTNLRLHMDEGTPAARKLKEIASAKENKPKLSLFSQKGKKENMNDGCKGCKAKDQKIDKIMQEIMSIKRLLVKKE